MLKVVSCIVGREKKLLSIIGLYGRTREDLRGGTLPITDVSSFSLSSSYELNLYKASYMNMIGPNFSNSIVRSMIIIHER